jgi:two-component system nitrogen regulation response regulator GlnG
MNKRVLILDDDFDFNTLLTDIFSQADYEVVSKTSPTEALEMFEREQFDVIISDQQMPEMPGSVFMSKVHEMDPLAPVIMVSGYLDNDTIRDLIRDGVAGVFLKPLNIMGLLERSDELVLESRRQRKMRKDEGENAQDRSIGSRLGFPFRSFPCRSERSIKFARKLYDYRNFKSTLCLVGERGTHFRAICEDLISMDEAMGQAISYLNSSSLNEHFVRAAVANQSSKGMSLLTFVILDLEALGEAEMDFLCQLAQRDNPFAMEGLQLRTIVCCHRPLDNLFEEGRIPDELYFSLGTTELAVPALRECVEDIPIMAQQYIVDAVRERALPGVPQIQSEAKRWLTEYQWPGNALELSDWMRRALARSGRGEITLNALVQAESSAGASSVGPSLSEAMQLARKEFVAAMGSFFERDVRKTAAALGVSRQAVESLMR